MSKLQFTIEDIVRLAFEEVGCEEIYSVENVSDLVTKRIKEKAEGKEEKKIVIRELKIRTNEGAIWASERVIEIVFDALADIFIEDPERVLKAFGLREESYPIEVGFDEFDFVKCFRPTKKGAILIKE